MRSQRRLSNVLPYCVLCGTLLTLGCEFRAAPSPAASTVQDISVNESRANTKREFEAVAEALEAGENRYLGRGQIGRLEKELSQAQGEVGRLVNLDLQLCWNYLRLGKLNSAKEAINRAFTTIQQNGLPPQASMYKLRALVFLRQAEFENCVQNHNAECCVFPLRNGGVHSSKSAIAACREDLLKWLKLEPNNLEAAWLLNVASQAYGDYPQGVPDAFRIDPQVFASAATPQPMPTFRDIAPQLGVDAFNLCGGAIVDDFTGDGRLDIVTSTYDPRGPLLFFQRNPGTDLSFLKHELTDQLGGLNCVAADYDGDGDLDVLVLRGAWLEDEGQIRNSLLQNNGDGTFVDVTLEAGLAEVSRPTQTAAWGDFDNDGDLDLYVGNESRAGFEPDQTRGNYPSQLFINDGSGRFIDVAATAGVTNDRYCKGVTAGDFDNDGDLDLYVSNRGPNRLYRNNRDGTFTDVAVQLGVTEPEGQSFATWFFDYDNDGWLDLFVAAYQASNADVAASYVGAPNNGVSPRLYRNRGDGRFEDVTTKMGLDRVFLPMGANFGDIDSDGFLDIYLTTGRPDFATLTPNVMLRNDQGARFQDVTTVTGLGHLQKGHGVAFADFDEDGDQDIYHQLGGFFPSDKFHNALFINEAKSGTKHRFLNVAVRGSHKNSCAIGARLRVTVVEGGRRRTIHRAIGTVSSFGGSPFRQSIGLGNATSIELLEVDWPEVDGASSDSQQFFDIPLDTFLSISETTGDLESQR